MAQTISVALVGAPKAGTTSVLRWLGEHPDLATHRTMEMTHFFNDAEFAEGTESGFERYYGADSAYGARLVMKHVMTMFRDTPLERLREHNNAMKIIVCLREPVARAYSEFWFNVSRGKEPSASFEEALGRDESLELADFEQQRMLYYLWKGQYAQHLERVYRYFPREQVEIVLSDDLRAGAELCRRLFEFVGVDPGFEPRVERAHNETSMPRSAGGSKLLGRFFAPGNRLRKALRKLVPDAVGYRVRNRLWDLSESGEPPPPIDSDLKQRLQESFVEPNAALEAMLGKSLDAWRAG